MEIAMKANLSEEVSGFLQGVAYVTAELNRSYDIPSIAAEILRAAGTYKDFVNARVDEYDLIELRDIRRTENWK